MNLHNAEFLKSVTSPQNFIQDDLWKIVFAGKSNVGKSSVINRILNRKSLARTSGMPGKTIHINYFTIDQKAYFVDLPGYGYAKVAKTEKARWAKLMEQFFAAGNFDLGILIVDSRHKPTENDIVMANWFLQTGHPFIVVANKLDKLKKSQIEPNLALIRESLNLPDIVEIYPFSAEKGTGKPELVARLQDVVKQQD